MLSNVTLETGMAIAPHLRSQCCHGLPGAQAARAVLEASKASYGLILRGQPVLVWGLIAESFMSREAYIWGLVSEYAERHPIAIGRASKLAIRKALELYDVLYTTTEVGYDLADKWVRWLGFTEIESEFPGIRCYKLETT